jgi:predicted nucleotidyltransferase
MEDGMIILDNIRKLHPSVSPLVENYVNKLAGEYGDNLVSVSVYGSAEGMDFNPKKSDINVLIVLKKIELSDLKRYSAMKKIATNISPLVFTKEYIRSSQDVYPIEFLEMKDRYFTVYGEDVLAGLAIDKKYLRLECEQQLKGSLLKLRHGFLKFGQTNREIEKLLSGSINTIITIFNNLIRLKGENLQVEKEKTIDKTAKLYGFNGDVFLKVYSHKRGINKINHKDVEECFNRYLNELDVLINKVDAL